MVCFRYIVVNTLHKDDNKDDDDDDDNNNNNNTSFSLRIDLFSLILLLNQHRFPRFGLQVSDCITFYNTCDVPNRAVLYNELLNTGWYDPQTSL